MLARVLLEKTNNLVLTMTKIGSCCVSMSLGQMFEESCRRYTDNVCIIYDGTYLTYEVFNRYVNALANGLRNLGIQKGDKVAVMLPNCPEFVISYFAIQKIGAVAVTLNILSTSYELRYLLANSDSKCLITETPLAKRYEEIREDIPLCSKIITCSGLETDSPFNDIIERGPFSLEMPEIVDDDPAVIIYTAGLTGKPLGAVLTHRNLLSQSDLLGNVYHATEKYRGLAVIPLFHAFGAVVNMLGAIRIGAGIVLLDRVTMDAIFSTVEKERVTYIAAVPRLFLGMIMHREADKYDMSSLDFCITGGSTMPPEFIPKFEEKFKVILREGYGLTEASPVCSVGMRDMVHKPGSIGTVIPGVEAKIVDEQGNEVPRGEIGELVIRGENVMKGYYKDNEATTRVIRNGWLYTSDLARIDEDGYIFLKGLKKRMIITSGFNVYPQEVEQILGLHPAVKASIVVGEPNLLRGEIVKALIVRNPDVLVTERDITRHCRTYLSSYKVPRAVEFVESLDAQRSS
ncbi:MAG TPA: AMP-binding protein [Syntrophales bacterium]|nr:AMP-binding protein [Syntrophales bacterium]